MARFKLEPYVFRIQRTDDDSKDSINPHLNNIDNNGTDFFDVVINYLKEVEISKIMSKINQTIQVDSYETYDKENRCRDIYGTLKNGEYGVAADFLNVETNEYTHEARTKSDSEVYPFFFYFHIPSDMDRGILILQTYKAHSIKTIFQKSINDYLNNTVGNGITLTACHLMSEDILKKIERNRVYEINLIRYDVSRESAERFHNGDISEIKEIRTISANYKKSIDVTQWFKDLLTNNKTNYYEIMDERYDEIKVIVEEDGRKITLTSGEISKYRESMVLDVDDTLLYGGFPKREYTLKKAEAYLDHIVSKIEQI